MKDHFLISLRMTVVMTILTCAIYPGVVFAIAQLAFPRQANGSFVPHGSALIGQAFTSERFFHSRPSASSYDGTNSGGTNLGPTSKKLRDAISAATKAYDVQTNVPADAVTSSASGLDPHISPENAYAQASRVARLNHLGLGEVKKLIDRHTEARFLGIFGEPRVNVLLINLDLAEHR
jgi:K+-transporting ATPase ATPase C chain